VERVNHIIEHRVRSAITSIQQMIFFDYKLAFSKRWVRRCNINTTASS
jgi:hypothetical protein